MVFRSLAKIWALVAVVGLMTGCQSDKLGQQPDEENPGEPGKVAYMSVSVSLPLAGGAQTPRSVGKAEPHATTTEAGLDHENTVKRMLLVLADKNNNYCASGVVEGLNSTGANLNATAEFSQTSIGTFYDENGNLKANYDPIRVFVFCNPTFDLLENIKLYESGTKTGSDWVHLTCNIDDNLSVWGKGSFLMSNYAIAERKLPNRFSQWASLYASPNRAFDLSGSNGGGVDNSIGAGRGSIKVERSVVRLDFKDGSGNGNTYDIGVGAAHQLKVQLIRMALVNMGKGFYYLRHMAADKQSNVELLTEETSLNYVVDVDVAKKNSFITNPDYTALKNLFNYPLFNEEGKINDNTRTQWDSYKISDVLENTEDNTDYNPSGYHVWRYVTENTLLEANNQVSGLSTGVVFKGKLLAGEELNDQSDLYKAIGGTYQLAEGKQDFLDQQDGKSYPVLFLFQNNLYVGWESGVKASEAFDDENSSLYRAVTTAPEGNTQTPDELYGALLANPDDEAALTAFRKAATAAGFTLYQASNDNDNVADGAGAGYYFYYYYWNRHRDNGEVGQMGPMEFATVRNNVYKLSVTSISKIGYPRIQDNNPDPIKPTDPDEDSESYITVAVEVLPWVVRENNIDF